MNSKIISAVAALALSAALAMPAVASAQAKPGLPGGMTPTQPQDTAGRRPTPQPAPTPTTQPAPTPAPQPAAHPDTADNGPDPSASVSPTARTAHPAIVDAMHALWLARGELRHGATVFGGHRVKAIKSINEAIDQLHQALRYADQRERKTAKRTTQ
jgi:hypothetical protein